MLAGNGVPSSNLVRGDMRLSESAKATLGKAFVYVGTGASVTDDRVYIKVRAPRRSPELRHNNSFSHIRPPLFRVLSRRCSGVSSRSQRPSASRRS